VNFVNTVNWFEDMYIVEESNKRAYCLEIQNYS